MRRWARLALAALVALGICAGVAYVLHPELILRVMVVPARLSAGLERRTLEVAGHQLVYLDGGSGPPVVLLHGFGTSKDLWSAVAAKLTPSHRVIAPDLPGFGESPALESRRYGAEQQAALTRAFLETLGVRQHHMGGNSMGGLIAAVYAATYPQAVSSLLIGGAPGVRSPEKSDLERRLEAGENPMLVSDEGDLDALMELAFFRPPSIPGWLKRAMLAEAVRHRSSYARIFDDLVEEGQGALEPLLPRIGARTLVVWGAEDRLVHPSSAALWKAAIAGAESTIFEACGHALPRECPDRLAERYLTFLASVP